MGYQAFRALCKHVVVNVFFRQVDVVGAPRIPGSGAVIFVANHNNQFVDPMMLIALIDRVVRFLTAAKSMRRPLVGAFARAARAIGVERPQDLAKKCAGSVSCHAGSTSLRGTGTAFLRDLHVGARVKAGDVEMAVKSIESDTLCAISAAPADLSDAAYKVLPFVDQTEMYDQVHAALRDGDCIGIFPEGGSHDQAMLLDLKPGVAVMALGAMQAGARSVQIVPCGLNYFDPYRFRSRVIVEFGEPFEVPRALVGEYGSNKRKAVQELMTMVDDAMKGVMPGAADWDELQAFLTMRALYKPRTKTLSPEETLKLNKMFALARRRLTDDGRMKGLLAEVREYSDLLRAAGLRDRDVRLSLVNETRLAWRTCSAALQLVFLAPLTVPMLLWATPVAWVTSSLAKREKRQALANSTVKVKALDVVASYKILVGIVFIPLYNLALAIVGTAFFRGGFAAFLGVYFLAVPVVIYVGIRACDVSVRAWRRCRATLLFRGCSVTAGILQQLLVERRKRLQAKVREFVQEVAPMVAEDAEEEQMLQARQITRDLDLLAEEGALAPGGGGLTDPLLNKAPSRRPQAAGACAVQ